MPDDDDDDGHGVNNFFSHYSDAVDSYIFIFGN